MNVRVEEPLMNLAVLKFAACDAKHKNIKKKQMSVEKRKKGKRVDQIPFQTTSESETLSFKLKEYFKSRFRV